MSVRWITWAWDQQVPPGEKLTLIALADHAGEDGSAYPGCGRLAEKTGQGESTVRRHLDSLEAAGLLTRVRRRRKDGTLGTYLYALGASAQSEHWDDQTTAQIEHHQRSPVSGSPALTRERAEPSVSEPSDEPSDLNGWFEQFWAAYGRVGPKKVARDCFMKAIKRGATPEEIMTGLDRWLRYWSTPGAARQKWPQGWLNQEYYRDVPPSIAPRGRPQLQPAVDAALSEPVINKGMAILLRQQQARRQAVAE